MISFRLPEINAPTADGQLRQLRSYLYQLTEQLNLAMDSVDSEISKQKQTVSDAVAASDTPEGKLKTFNSVKALIIKSADIITAYTEEISKRLEGVYVAESEFGEYKRETSQKITETSEGIEQQFQVLEELIGELTSTIKANAYIRTGRLDDGNSSPIFGVEVGQQTEIDGQQKFSAFARFTASKLSFFDNNDIEVAYISNYQMVISKAHILSTLTLGLRGEGENAGGKFEIDTANGLSIKWVGG